MSKARHLPYYILSFLVAVPWIAHAAPEVHVERRHGVFQVHADTPVAVDAQTAWQVLTDYNQLAEFVPDMRMSRIISAPGEPLLLEQKGGAGFLLFQVSIEVVLQIDEIPPERLKFHAVSGNMKQMRGEWRISRADRAVRLSYDAELEPDFWVPPVIGAALMRRDIGKQIDGVVHEMLKRHGAGRDNDVPRNDNSPPAK
jgi:ribosome-associated toxin RatA of RatAB toxin-antitoxin module